MLTSVEKVRTPHWLKVSEFKFDIRKILKDSLYYPCCGYDGDPIKYFNGNVFSFVYVDYRMTRKKLEDELLLGCRGYHIIHRERISRRQLYPKGWDLVIEPTGEFEEYYKKASRIFHKFAEWIIFERNSDFDSDHGTKRFSLLVINDEAVFTYQKLYLNNKISPFILAVIQPGHGFGGNWTNFYDKNKIFYKTVHYYEKDYKDELPRYMVTNTCTGKADPEWEDYSILVDVKDKYVNRATNSDWKYDGKLYIWEYEDEIDRIIRSLENSDDEDDDDEDEIDRIIRSLENSDDEDDESEEYEVDLDFEEDDETDDKENAYNEGVDIMNKEYTNNFSLENFNKLVETVGHVVLDELIRFYTAKTHQDVISLIEGSADIENTYKIVEGPSYKIYIPKYNFDKKLPLLSCHTDVFFHRVTKDIVINHKDKQTILTSDDDEVGIGGDCRNGCYIISKIMNSDFADKFMFAIFDKEEIGSIGARSMPNIDEVINECSCYVGLDGFHNSDIAIYPETSEDIKTQLENIFPKNKLVYGYMTDVVVMSGRFNVPAVVLPIGYYNQHTPQEYVILEDIEQCLMNTLNMVKIQ